MTDKQPAILLVDDDVDICGNMADIFSDLGYHVDVAHEGRSALRLVRERSYDVAILDLKMPGMDGLTLYREIKKIQAGVVALLVTAYAGGSTAEEAVSAGMWQVIPKPVDPTHLMRLIDSALEQPLVLVVDDDAELCANLWDLLRERGYRVCIANTGREAAERFRESTRVVLLDLKLPDRNGAEVLRELRESNPETRTILITGHRAEAEPIIEQLRREGADAICYKPFNVTELLGTVQQLVRT